MSDLNHAWAMDRYNVSNVFVLLLWDTKTAFHMIVIWQLDVLKIQMMGFTCTQSWRPSIWWRIWLKSPVYLHLYKIRTQHSLYCNISSLYIRFAYWILYFEKQINGGSCRSTYVGQGVMSTNRGYANELLPGCPPTRLPGSRLTDPEYKPLL